MATLSPGGRVTSEAVVEEIDRLRALWKRDDHGAPSDEIDEALGAEGAAEVDPFDRAQLAEVLRVCRSSRTLSDAGRALFAISRTKKSSVNDADRLRKYLARFGLDWKQIAALS